MKIEKLKNSIIAFVFCVFSSCGLSETANTLQLQESVDFTNPTTRSFALALASKNDGPFNIDQVCNVYSYIYDNWKYVNDPRGVDYFSKASETINNNLTGDCDDFAILMAATIEAIGGKTRVVFITEENGVGHAFTEVYLDGDPNEIRERIDYHYQNIFQSLFGLSEVAEINYYNADEGGIWLNLDWQSKYPGGAYPNYLKRTVYYPREGYYETKE